MLLATSPTPVERNAAAVAVATRDVTPRPARRLQSL